jgi:hypothetical protein
VNILGDSFWVIVSVDVSTVLSMIYTINSFTVLILLLMVLALSVPHWSYNVHNPLFPDSFT